MNDFAYPFFSSLMDVTFAFVTFQRIDHYCVPISTAIVFFCVVGLQPKFRALFSLKLVAFIFVVQN